MKSQLLFSKAIIFTIFFITCNFQNSQPTPTDQNSIDPIIVNNAASIPASATPNNQSVNQASPTDQSNQGVLLSNTALHGLQGQAIPVDQATINQAINAPKPQMTQQALAKAKQQAQKARQMAQQARRQAQIDRKQRQQRQDDQLRNIQNDQTLSKTQRKKQQERLLFRKIARTVEDGTRFTQYLFQQGLGSSQFFIKIPTNQQVAMNFYTYVAQDNTYIRTKNIEQEQPVKIYIYENNQKVIYEGEFYYQNYVVFQGQANAMYLIRVVNNGRTKLISMNSKKLVEQSHLSTTLQKTDGEHVQRTKNLAIDINKWYQQFRKIRMLDFQDLKAVQGYIEKYYSWQIVQTIVAIVFCFVQVKMIQNMLKGTTIV